jgi:putative nucleotidyltransferase with HDIG domain
VEAAPQPNVTRPQESVRKYFREVMAQYKLPPLPVVASKVLTMIEDPDLNIREICRVLSDDPALAARVMAISRSAHYAQRNLPKNLQAAIQVVGLHSLRYILIAAATQGLFTGNSPISAKLWSHSLAVALAARILAQRVDFSDPDQAFLTGLLHDVGEMILCHGDPVGFELMLKEVERNKLRLVEKEKQTYAFDHAFIGLALFDSWNIDSEIGQAVFSHHEEGGEHAGELAAILRLSDYISFSADLGFYGDPPVPAEDTLRTFGCGDEASLKATLAAVREAFEVESALFQNV